MTSASSTTAHRHPPKAYARRTLLWLAAGVAALVMILIGLPDGVAEPLQAVLAWTVVAAVAVLAVMAIAKGLYRLLDCESP
jgi:cell division protein FtsW (lipid II flippase)